MSYYVDPNTQQMYYQAPAQQNEASPVATAVPQNAAAPPAPSTFLGLNVGSSTFWTGAILGAGVALLVTSETVQKAVVKTVSKGMAAASAGVEEFKEKFEDAKAEVEAEAAGKK
nr:hypothetical protein [uncultured Desulfobacter sp.]